jgi:hypothetical protein
MKVADQTKSITKFIFNHTCILNLMRKNTRSRDLVSPNITRIPTNFLGCNLSLTKGTFKENVVVMNGLHHIGAIS